MYHTIPNQRIPISQKKDVFKKETMDAYLSLTEDGRYNRREFMQTLYDYYNGVINDTDYDYVLRPYGKKREYFPSKMRNYPLIKPVIDFLLGEKAKRPFNYSVIALNPDSVTRKEEELQKKVFENLQQHLVNKMGEVGLETGQEPKEVPPPEEVARMFERNYVDNRAALGQRAITYILQQQEVHDKIQKGWFHWLVAGEVFSERGVRNGEPFYDMLNPLDVDYDLDPELDFVEDGDWAIVNKYMSPSSIIEAWGKLLTETQIEEIFTMAGKGDYFSNFMAINDDRRNALRNRLIHVRCLYWKGMERVGFLTYMDPETGGLETEEVEDGFRIPPEMKDMGAKLTWEWRNRTWQGIRIGEDMDIDVKPVEHVRASLENPNMCKLPVNGRRYSDINSPNISLVTLGIPYQLNYNVFKYRLELAIARSKDLIAQFDINLIPKKWDMDKWMYHVDGSGIAWVDYDKEGVRLNPAHQTVMDLSIKTISMYIELLTHVEQEWHRVAGVNSQRLGEMSQYQGKATGQQAIIQSSHTTEDTYRKFASFERRDLQALLDYSKPAWTDGKRSMFTMPDGGAHFLDIEPQVWMEADLGIFMSDATKEVEKMNAARDLTQPMLQNGAPISAVLDVLNEDSFVLMKDKIKAVEDELKAAQEQARQQELQMQQEQMKQAAAIAEQEATDKELDRQVEREGNVMDRQTKLEVARINAASRQSGEQPAQPQQVESPQMSDKERADIEIKQQKQNLDSKSLGETVRHNKATEQIAKSKPAPGSSTPKKK